jgi:hypothetical protein
VTRSPLGEVRKCLAALGIETELRRGDVREGDFDCLEGSIDGTRFDVMPRLVPLEWERAIEVALSARKRLRVVDLDGPSGTGGPAGAEVRPAGAASPAEGSS